MKLYYENDENRKHYIVDYIGPSIDTGFRLSTLSSSRKFVVSLELAHILSLEQHLNEQRPRRQSTGAFSLTKFEFRYDGRKNLKGVFNGAPYPVFWIDLAPVDETNIAEDSVLNTSKPNAQQISKLTTALIKGYSKYLSQPFFFENENYSSPIEGYECLSQIDIEKLKELKKKFTLTEEKRATEEQAFSNLNSTDSTDSTQNIEIKEIRLTIPSIEKS